MKENWLKIFLKGLCVGGTMLVPGVSGGSMAMILGIYDKLITSVSSFFACKKRNALFLLLFALGGGAGMLLFANPLLYLLQRYPLVLRWFFIGAVAGSTPMMLKKAQIHSVSWRLPVFLVVGFSAVALFSILPAADASGAENPGALFLICAGLVAAVALVLPGISVSYLLLMMDMYNTVIQSISRLYLPYLLPLGAGVLLGIILTTKLLERAMEKHPQQTYLLILGFVLGSLPELFPGFPVSVPQWLGRRSDLAALLTGGVIISAKHSVKYFVKARSNK